MATVIDITNKIKNEEKFIAYNGKTYKVDDGKNTVIKAQAILASAPEDANISTIEEAMAELLGKEAVKDFENLSMEDYLVVFYGVMACVNGKTYEETEAMFREARNG